MEINTQYFGKISCSEEEFIHFSDGLFGFTDLKNYVPLAFQDNSDTLICLQSVEDLGVSFILMNPFQLYADYVPVLSEEDKRLLNVFNNEEAVSYYVICVIHDSMDDSTVNLKCPIAVNTENREARQVILDNPLYKFRHPIRDFVKKGD
ncbi:flagellar assembly protein FliW [Clostridium sp. Marseille-P2415]|uniref:flagellar assembly protein FliW n=1 Tax=Clostridium sp. Marseille-P2415 TaxID=1805471 RepID=UPI0009884D5D|nr:flagellar assembly protein FliW [Clostridium sp. Marseille-P2415]